MGKIVVGIADIKVSNNPEDTLITYALGSCIGVIVYDPVVKVGGLLHFMLPESKVNPQRAKENPYMFADTGVPLLFKTCYKYGAKKRRMIVKVAGGAEIMDEAGYFNIGKKNYAVLRKIFWRNGVLIRAEDVGGMVNRTVELDIVTGEVRLKITGQGIRKL
ncbi:MAG TPA: chemotaxis protein CheD [Candidatus Desulfofervidus auxilii]|uniref:Probable chemoreceptor glutamine deamidase CheD n=1 Tax=Desulfofervidus auxilii TaxID=1621989 RepID=A0A7V1N2I2_DESA2|nr:chemotaxis protein CheD [Candidatus Desulfofervidus auxilii]